VPDPSRILLISGSLRARSTNTAVLLTAHAVTPPGIVTSIYTGLAALPHFTPDDDVDPLPPPAAALRAAIHTADALLFSTPEYAGALPGSFKNLLDWTIGDDQPGSIYEKPVAWINASTRGAENAHDSLRTVLAFAHAEIVEDACAHIAVASADVDEGGLIPDAGIRRRIERALRRLAVAAQRDH